MLESLKCHEKSEAMDVLARAMGALLPDPLTGEVSLPAHDDEALSLIREVARRFRADLSDLSADQRVRILDHVGQEYSSLALKGVDKKEIRNRLGARGSLAPIQFKVTYSSLLKRDVGRRGLSLKEVEATVKRPTMYQHLFSTKEMGAAPPVSLFVHYNGLTDKRFHRWVFVIALRQGCEINALNAWHVFSDDLPEGLEIETPLDLLEAYCDVFGIPMHFCGLQGEKFLFFRRVKNISPDDFHREAVQAARSSGYDSGIGMFGASEAVDTFATDISVASFFDMNKYRASLTAHGIKFDQTPRR